MVDSSTRRARLPIATLRAGLENVTLGVLFTLFALSAFLTWRQTGHVQMLLLAAQEVLMIGLAVTRRRTIDTSQSWWDATIALVGTATPLFQRAGGLSLPSLVIAGTGIQIIGAALALVATFSLGRSFGVIAANRGVKTGGLYRLVRHPLYGSYLLSYLGFLLGNLSLLNLLVVGVSFLCQYLRARAEEQVLLRDSVYQEYARRVRYRFITFIL
jgi:protein-S-isoprenylcysteine O-methyltransferase Ste14